MKILSVLFTAVLFVTAHALAAHLSHTHALPARSTQVTSIHHKTQHNQ
jgi:hypothetical protein